MSSRPYAGRHRPGRHGVRIPRTLTGGFILPTTAAVTLLLTATGASVAESHNSVPLAVSGAQTLLLTSQEAEAKADDALISQRRSEAQLQAAALLGRQQEAERAARAAHRAALAKKAAAARAAARAAAEAARTRWVFPLTTHFNFTSAFKWRWGAFHSGDDFAVSEGSRVGAMSTGTVVFVGWMGGGGNTVKIRYWDGTESFYEHMSRTSVSVGQHLGPGNLVGYSGNTGHSTGPHLHLEIHPGGRAAVDPMPWLHKHGLITNVG